MTHFEQLLRVAGIKPPKPSDNKEEFIKALLRVVSTCSDQAWRTLSGDAQDWFNVAVKKINALQPIPPLEGYTDKEVEPTSEANDKLSEPVPVPTKTVKPAPTPAEKAGTTPQMRKTHNKRSSSGVLDLVRRTTMVHPDWTGRQIFQYAQENGFPQANPETVNVNVSDLKRIIKIAQDLGFWNNDNYTKNSSSNQANQGVNSTPNEEGGNSTTVDSGSTSDSKSSVAGSNSSGS